MENKIKSVLIICRERPTEEFDVYYCVGRYGTSRIEKGQRTGDMAYIDIYNIYKDEKLIATIERPDVIEYEVI